MDQLMSQALETAKRKWWIFAIHVFSKHKTFPPNFLKKKEIHEEARVPVMLHS